MLPTIIAAHVALTPLLAPPSPKGLAPLVASATPDLAIGMGIVRRSSDLRSIPRGARPYTSVIEIDHAALRRFSSQGGGVLEGMPLGREATASLVLEPIEPFGDDAILERPAPAADGSGVRRVRWERLHAEGVFLRGSVVGAPDSHAFLAVSDAGTFGFVEWDDRIYIISSGPRWRGLPTASYDLTSMPRGLIEVPAWTCGRDAAPIGDGVPRGDGGVAGAASDGVAGGTCRQVRVAFDTDHEFFQLMGSDVPTATAYVATLSAALTSIYSRDLSTRIAATYLRLWPDADDPWTQTDTLNQILQLRSNWLTQGGAVQRELVHMLSGRALGGGIAYMPGLCTASSGYGLSANLAGFFPTPLLNNSAQNWDIFVVAHELGHNFGMEHTHEMQPPLDGCGLSPQDCTVANQDAGTIMSYCHLCAGGVTNIRLEFHPANIAAAESYLGAIACNYAGPARPPIAAVDTVDAFTGVPLRIDVLANDEPFNCESIVISSFDATTPRGASVSRSVGTGSGGRDELLYSAPAGAATGSDSFTYTVTDASGQTATTTVALALGTLRVADNPVGATSQIDASYFVVSGASSIPNYDAATPYALGTVPQVNFPLTFNAFATSGRADDVGARFRGWLSVPTSGNWRLYSSSDEGSRISIGSTVVVNHDGIHGLSERSGVIALEAGLHAITIDYFERTGSAGLVVSWQGPGVAKQVIPSSRYFRGGSNLPADLTNDGKVDAVDVAILLANWGQVQSPYDLTGDGLINGADLAAILFAWTG